jgi:hypothetical protein
MTQLKRYAIPKLLQQSFSLKVQSANPLSLPRAYC